MRKLTFTALGIGTLLAFWPARVNADQDITNRWTFSARFGFNISARFKGLGDLPAGLVNSRTTLDGDRYNYDDGYVYPDSSGSVDGLTWYWGYLDKANQFDRADNTILMHRSVPASDIASPSFDSDPNYGAEVVYSRQLGVKGKVRYGFEVAASYLSLGLRDSDTFSGNAIRTTYVNPPAVEPGTEPPPVSQTSGPWEGREGPTGSSFLINANFTAVSPTETVPGSVVVSGQRRFDADIWGLRIGPYLEIPVVEPVSIFLSGGLAVAWLDGTASWSENVSVTGGAWTASGSGRGQDVGMIWGGYVGAAVAWQLSDQWSAVGGVQYQNLGTYRKSFGGRQVEVDFQNSIFVTLGLTYCF